MRHARKQDGPILQGHESALVGLRDIGTGAAQRSRFGQDPSVQASVGGLLVLPGRFHDVQATRHERWPPYVSAVVPSASLAFWGQLQCRSHTRPRTQSGVGL